MAPGFLAVCVVAAAIALSCAHTGRLENVARPIAPPADTTESAPPHGPVGGVTLRALFSDTLIGFVTGSGDSSRRYLGRLRKGYTADTLNILLCGDNRPAYRTARLRPDFVKIRSMFSLNPARFFSGLVAIPVVLVKGIYPDLALIRDLPAAIRRRPTDGREGDIIAAMLAKVDSLEEENESVAAVINTGDLVKDGRYPAHWRRFLKLVEPLASRVPYFPIAGNHERTDTEEGLANWRAATGLPISGDRLYYCFDSADGWVRFIALDSNPMTDPANHWTREVEVQYSDEQIEWMVARLKEHRGPAFVFLHHPPFSSGFHRVEWESDPVLRERRERMVRALHEARIGILAAGHEHAYERALLTWPDAVLISIVTGGAGSPLHDIPSPEQSAQMFSEYQVGGSVIKPENVFTAERFHFVHMRLWFGGGEFHTYALEDDGSVKLLDQVEIDLKRYGVPKIDQHKVPLPSEKPDLPPPAEETKEKQQVTADSDSLSASRRLESKPPPAPKPKRKAPAEAKADSVPEAPRPVISPTPPR